MARVNSAPKRGRDSVYAIDVLMGTYLRVMVVEWDCVMYKGACKVVVCKSCHGEDEEPILTIRYDENSKGDMIPLSRGLAEKIAKRIVSNPYRFLKNEITPIGEGR